MRRLAKDSLLLELNGFRYIADQDNKKSTDFRGPQRMNPNDVGDFLTLTLVPPQG